MNTTELRRVPLFSEMDDQEASGILKIMDEVRFAPGEAIISEGEVGDLFYVLTDGRVQEIVRNLDGEEIVLHEIGPGGFFGEASMLAREPRTARIRAVGEVTALALDRDEFFSFLRNYPNAALDVLIELSGRLHDLDDIVRRSASRNVNVVESERLTLGEKVADRVADTIGSWPFIIIQSAAMAAWLVLNIAAWIRHWDPYPFILLNLMLSFQAAYAGPIIMMSQNRQSAKDRLAAEIDHQVNQKAELEVGLLLKRVDDIERILHINREEQKGLLKRLSRR